jgi:uncharacterized membrane protein (UPF0127 family)
MYLKTYSTKKILLAFIKVFVIIVGALLLFWAFSSIRTFASYHSYEKERILIKSAVFVGYVADTEGKRMQGLSGKAFLPPNTGMLFEFDRPDTHGIWMKDMLFPVDIIWLSEDKRIVNLISNADPASYPHVYYPPKNSLYVLEVRAGLVKDRGLKLGDEILFGKESSDNASGDAE